MWIQSATVKCLNICWIAFCVRRNGREYRCAIKKDGQAKIQWRIIWLVFVYCLECYSLTIFRWNPYHSNRCMKVARCNEQTERKKGGNWCAKRNLLLVHAHYANASHLVNGQLAKLEMQIEKESFHRRCRHDFIRQRCLWKLHVPLIHWCFVPDPNCISGFEFFFFFCLLFSFILFLPFHFVWVYVFSVCKSTKQHSALFCLEQQARVEWHYNNKTKHTRLKTDTESNNFK